MNTGHIQVERAEKAQQKPTAEPLDLYSSHSDEHYIDALKDDGTDDGANFNVCKLEYPANNTLSEEQRTVNAAELVKRWNAYPDMLKALEDLFEHCSMIHTKWGEGCNIKEANAAIEYAKAVIARAKAK